MLHRVTGPASLALLLGCAVGCGTRNPEAPKARGDAASPPPTKPAQASEEEAFWAWFGENQARLLEAAEADPGGTLEVDPMNAALKKVHPALLFELPSRAAGAKQELVITADGDREAFPAVTALVAAAPDLEHWLVTAFRQPSAELDFEVHMEGIVLSPQTVLYRSQPAGEKLDITIYLAGKLSTQDPPKSVSFILLDHILGEYDVETRLGAIDWAATPQEQDGLKPLAKLREEVAELKR